MFAGSFSWIQIGLFEHSHPLPSLTSSIIITDTLLSPLRLPVLGDSKRDLSRFWEVMVTLSGLESTGVLPLQQEVIAVLGDSNPFWTHARRCLWIAERDGRVVGRIAGIIDPTHQKIRSAVTEIGNDGFGSSILINSSIVRH